jgi:hypothetical protein
MDFEKLFKDLRVHLLSAYNIANNRLSEAELKSFILDTDIKSIEFDNDSFKICGEMQVFGEKRHILNTTKIQVSDGFDGYDEVREIIEALKIEAVSYMDGLKIVSDREMMLRWLEAKKDANMSKDQFEALSDDEQKAYMAKILNTKFGADIEILEDDQEEDGIEIPEDATVIEIDTKKKGKKVKESQPETGTF